MSRKLAPSIYTTKSAFLSDQVRMLSMVPSPPLHWRESQPAADDEHGDLSDAVVRSVLYKLAIVARKHHSLVFSAQTLRHIAEQVDALYWSATEVGLEGEVGAEVAVLRAGVDLRLSENIDALPESYPRETGESEEDLERYQTLRARLMDASGVLQVQRQKRDHYARLRDMVRPFERPVENIQPNLVTRDGALNAELEKTKTLAMLLAVQLERAGIKLPPPEEDNDEEMGDDDDEDGEEEKMEERKREERFKAIMGKK